MITMRRATGADAAGIAPRLREEDRAECRAVTGMNPEAILPLSVSVGESWVFEVDGVPEAIMGVSGVDQHSYFGIVWMLATPELLHHRRYLLKMLPEVLDMLHTKYPLLGNHVDVRNKVHVRWIKRCGFSMLRVIPEFGVGKLPFIEFAKLRAAPCA